jgi:transaldolase
MLDQQAGEESLALRRELLFETPPDRFVAAGSRVIERLTVEYEASAPGQAAVPELVAGLAIDLSSYLAEWHLLAPGSGLGRADVRAVVERLRDVLARWGEAALLQAADDEIAAIARSNLRRISELTARGEIANPLGHDAATGLTWAVRRGAIMVTTNPVMINTVRLDDPATWDPVRDALKAAHPDEAPEARGALMTLDVVLRECRELRPIWQATDGQYGYVSLQISPRSAGDSGHMAEEAEELYHRLETELGGTPNTRFKIPGTHAGIEAVRRLTAAGIGVTVTVNASIDQQLAFGEVIERGSAPRSFLVLMMGRLDDPVRAELEAAGAADAEAVSRWASVAVLRRAYPLLFRERGFERSAIMTASMRGPWTIEGSIVDGPSPVFMTIFPDKARGYDAHPRPIASHIDEPLPAGVEEQLMRSQTFSQAYCVGALAPTDFDRFKPVVETLDQFTRNYEAFVDYNR